ncbi:MAG: aspartate carbamoyltransferase catalytic subunit [Alphaproteobacteria bacterium]|jgi:aspartate carbamoyltransferase catalytic subunit|nr:aspartate carbamoyltransferase catalytic subunit [Alphaproteobacteria bacterium]
MAHKANPATRHVISINDLSDKDIETIFEIAQSYLDELPDPHFPYRIGRSSKVASNVILASLFYEPSTRTRLSFESAMIRLGGEVITSADPATSSAAKGESLADSVRVISNYADIMVIRHPRDGAARLAAEYSPIPVINGGDGSHEHPTQTLCDLFLLKKKNKRLKNLKVAISGDLRGSRTIHSFVYALARFGATIMPMAAKGMELPAHVDRRLREEFGCQMVSVQSGQGKDASIDALYVTPEQPHQQSLFAGPELQLTPDVADKKVDAVYVTRFQKERWAEKEQAYPRIDRKFLNEPKYSDASVMHPLPRVGELDAAFDTDRRAVYFEQAAYGVPVRMALISLLLGLRNKSLHKFEGGFEKHRFPLYEQPRNVGMSCGNKNCIVHDPMESQYVRNKFYIVKAETPAECKLRCVYCESDIDGFVVASKKNKWFTADPSALLRTDDHHLKELVVFAGEADALEAGFHSRRAAAEPKPPQREGLRSKI